MPEGDTVYLVANRLHDALAGRVLTKTDLRVPRFATADLAGQAMREVVARGKHILMRVEGGTTLHTHLKMEGSWHLYRHGERWRGPGSQVRTVLANASWVAVGFRLGIVELLPTTQEDRVVGHLGPDVLGPDWDPDEVVRLMRKEPTRPIGDAFVDQSVIAGPGNVYRCEICFIKGLDPSTPVERVQDLEGVVALTKALMEANRTTGDQVTTGDLRPGHKQWVYGRGGAPCRRCGAPIARERAIHDGHVRVTYWCPSCQPPR